MTGSWFQMATTGQGVEVEVYPDLVAPGTGFMQAAWFTYDYKAPGGPASQRWYSFSGNVQSGQPSAALTLYENTGGNFNTPPVTRAKPVGSVVVSAADCDHLTMLYTFTDGSARSGIIPMTRLLPNVTCVASAPDTPNADLPTRATGSPRQPRARGSCSSSIPISRWRGLLGTPTRRTGSHLARQDSVGIPPRRPTHPGRAWFR